jgi:hypothetical protein
VVGFDLVDVERHNGHRAASILYFSHYSVENPGGVDKGRKAVTLGFDDLLDGVVLRRTPHNVIRSIQHGMEKGGRYAAQPPHQGTMVRISIFDRAVGSHERLIDAVKIDGASAGEFEGHTDDVVPAKLPDH